MINPVLRGPIHLVYLFPVLYFGVYIVVVTNRSESSSRCLLSLLFHLKVHFLIRACFCFDFCFDLIQSNALTAHNWQK